MNMFFHGNQIGDIGQAYKLVTRGAEMENFKSVTESYF